MDQRSPLTIADFREAARILKCEVAAIQAVAKVEASTNGFFPNGEPKTLLEGHHFYRFTGGLFAEQYPSICYPKWTKKWYGKTWQEEYRRFTIAFGLGKSAAIMSTSFGRFQIMGFNFDGAGFNNEFDFYAHMKIDEQEHLKAFVTLLTSWGLNTALRDCDWRKFAHHYNGPRYEENNYHVKLEEAYNTFKNYQL